MDREIATIRKLIFEHSPEDIETRLRMAVVYIRADKEPLPKKVWTDLIEDIFKDKLAQETKKAEVRGRLIATETYLDIGFIKTKRIQETEAIKGKLEAELQAQSGEVGE